MATDNVSVVKQMYRAFAQGDIPSVLQAMDPQIEWNEAENFPYADGNPYIGPAAILEGVFKRLAAEWETWSLALDEFFDARDVVVARGRYQAKHRETQVPLDAQFVHIWWLKDGRAVRFQQYTDTKQVAQVMGRR